MNLGPNFTAVQNRKKVTYIRKNRLITYLMRTSRDCFRVFALSNSISKRYVNRNELSIKKPETPTFKPTALKI